MARPAIDYSLMNTEKNDWPSPSQLGRAAGGEHSTKSFLVSLSQRKIRIFRWAGLSKPKQVRIWRCRISLRLSRKAMDSIGWGRPSTKPRHTFFVEGNFTRSGGSCRWSHKVAFGRINYCHSPLFMRFLAVYARCWTRSEARRKADYLL